MLKRQLQYLFLLVALGLVLAACATTISPIESEPPCDYTLSKSEYTTIGSDGESIQIPYVQMANLADANKMSSINKILKSVVEDVFVDNQYNWGILLKKVQLDITFQDDRYISLLYTIPCDEPEIVKNGAFRFGVVVDLASGERIFLDDIFLDLAALKDYLCAYKYGTEYSPPISPSEIESIIDGASKDEQEFLDYKATQHGDAQATLSFLKGKPSFYLLEEELVVIRDEFDMNDIFIER